MVTPTSRWTATPLLLLLLSSTSYAQYTLRGRVVQDNHKHSLGRRAEPAEPAESGSADKSAAGAGDDVSGDDKDPAGPEASSSTLSDKGDEGDDVTSGDEKVGGGDDAPTSDKDEASDDGHKASAVRWFLCLLINADR